MFCDRQTNAWSILKLFSRNVFGIGLLLIILIQKA